MMDITEKEFFEQIRDLAKLFGWKLYHTWRSIHSPAGYPDCTLTRDGRLVIAELKTETGQPTPEQYFWLVELSKVPCAEVYLWRPSQIEEIAKVLR